MNKIITTKLLMVSLLIIGGVTMAKNDKIAKGTTIGHYQKPGAPVDITYSSTKVGLNEVADINISLTTSVKSGEMEVKIDVDKNLELIGEQYSSIYFNLSPNQKSYDINMRVKSSKDGLYYIRLLTKIDSISGAKMRALAVPVYIGKAQLKKKNKLTIMKAIGGENISVSKAQETIEIIK